MQWAVSVRMRADIAEAKAIEAAKGIQIKRVPQWITNLASSWLIPAVFDAAPPLVDHYAALTTDLMDALTYDWVTITLDDGVGKFEPVIEVKVDQDKLKAFIIAEAKHFTVPGMPQFATDIIIANNVPRYVDMVQSSIKKAVLIAQTRTPDVIYVEYHEDVVPGISATAI